MPIVGAHTFTSVARSVAAVAALLVASAPVSAQTNVNVVEFLPAPAHHVVAASGQPVVARYEFLVYQAGALDPYLRVNLGKPAPQADGVIRTDFRGLVPVWPLPNVRSESRIAAYGPDGYVFSPVSNSFTYACSFALSATDQSFAAAGGTGTVQMTAGAPCGWAVSSAASWITPTAATGAGSAAVSFTVAAHTGTTDRTGTLTIGPQTLTILQKAPVATEPPPGTTPGTTPALVSYLSDLPWTSMKNGWGPAERDRSNGDKLAGDGPTLTLNGRTYAKGLGAHAPSDLRFRLDGTCSVFEAEMGVDDLVGANGSVVFQVLGDGLKLFDSGVMTGSTATRLVKLDVTGRVELALLVTDAGNGNASDHADWASARVTCADPATNPTKATAYVEQAGLAVLEAERYDAMVTRGGKSWVPQAAAAFAGGSAVQAGPNTDTLIDSNYVTTSPELR